MVFSHSSERRSASITISVEQKGSTKTLFQTVIAKPGISPIKRVLLNLEIKIALIKAWSFAFYSFRINLYRFLRNCVSRFENKLPDRNIARHSQ